MTFTDDDLKRWKSQPYSYAPECEDELLALLARLEAAEVIADRHNIEHSPLQHDYIKDEKRCSECRELKAWRKVTGK